MDSVANVAIKSCKTVLSLWLLVMNLPVCDCRLI